VTVESDLLLEAENLSKAYRRGPRQVTALRSATLAVRRGEFLSIIGPSGSGKSTLLHLLACLERPTSGTYVFRGQKVWELPESRLALIRNRYIGLVFQAYNLLPTLTALRNVALPLVYSGVQRRERARRALEALDRVGLRERAAHYPFELSGGEEQRVAIARALVTRPELLLADEPTGNLDTKAQEEFMTTVASLRQEGRTIIMVTHNSALAERADRRLTIVDGYLGETGVDRCA
jgi:putative ABC transport system ATP-binding protein